MEEVRDDRILSLPPSIVLTWTHYGRVMSFRDATLQQVRRY